jgi:hypothetical protein
LLEARWRSFGFRVGRAIVFSSIELQKLLVVVVVVFIVTLADDVS